MWKAVSPPATLFSSRSITFRDKILHLGRLAYSTFLLIMGSLQFASASCKKVSLELKSHVEFGGIHMLNPRKFLC